MTTWEETSRGVRVADAGSAVAVHAADWRPLDGATASDERTLGVATRIAFPDAAASLRNAATGENLEFAGTSERLSSGEYVLDVAAAIDVAARFEGPATVTRDGNLAVEFPTPRQVSLRAGSAARVPVETVTVPETAEGAATAITHAAAAHRTTTPDRSLQSRRRHPPAFEFGDERSIPDRVQAATPDTGIELVAPRSLRSLFSAAPLAYYLGADVTVEAGATPALHAPNAGVDYSFDDLATGAPDVLARVFWLDCLARTGSPDGPGPDGTGAGETRADATRLAEHSALDDLGLDAERLYDAPLADRLRAYLDCDFERVADRFPEWHLAMHVAPEFEHVPTLPSLLDRLAFVYPPETATLEKEELVSRSLDDFYRGTPGPVASVEMLDPVDRPGRTQGWLADGTPIDAFKTHPAAYRNHRRYLDRSRDGMSVAVVLNDRSMAGEHDNVADIYESRAEELPMDVTFHERLTRSELADVLTSHHEFVHYIGHCEVEGLRCADGHFSVGDLAETNVETFFLNACGSYHEGLDLVERGSVAGAVTLRKVLDEQAAKVGTAFARLLLHGFPIETALSLARRRIRMGKDYAVVGDGTQTLSGTDDGAAPVVQVTSQPSGDYHVSWADHAIDRHGDTYAVEAAEPGTAAATETVDSERPRLCGNATEFTATGPELAAQLADADLPVVLDGRFFWADEAVRQLPPTTHVQ